MEINAEAYLRERVLSDVLTWYASTDYTDDEVLATADKFMSFISGSDSKPIGTVLPLFNKDET